MSAALTDLITDAVARINATARADAPAEERLQALQQLQRIVDRRVQAVRQQAYAAVMAGLEA